MLLEFHTGFAYGKDSLLYRIFSKMPGKIYRKISNRFIDDVPDKYIRRQPFIELKALLKLKFGQNEEDVLYRRNQQFQENISNEALKRADAVIGFDTSSWILAQRCRTLSKKFFLDVSIAHPVSKDKVYRNIIKQYPDWKFSIKQKDHKHIAVEEAEMEMAHHIVVASGFTNGTYVEHGVSTEKISINPYGVDADSFRPMLKNRQAGDLVQFVFVGSVDARKGIPFLLETWKAMNTDRAQLTLIGPVSADTEKFIRTNYPSVIVKGKLPFSEVKQSLPGYDVMIFPSFFEGFGLVIPEAMASALPVITTTATCGPDVMENGKDGFIIEPGDVQALRHSIEFFINTPAAIKTFGKAAREKSVQLSWDAYGERWQKSLEEK